MRNVPPTAAVTGAFGYSGAVIAARLLAAKQKVRTLTNAPRPAGAVLEAHPLCFEDEAKLAASLQGIEVLYNTYWVRFNHRRFSHDQAVRNSEALFRAAKRAGVRKVVHVSITNADEESPLSYFAGKGRVERALRESGLEYSILRPAVLFGGRDILINNIAWALRKFPLFGIFGDGTQYGLQPIHVEDLARIAVGEGEAIGSNTIEAIGPETFSYRGLVEMIADSIGSKAKLVSLPPAVGYRLGRLIGQFKRDVFITRDEIRGLMAGLLQVNAPHAGRIRLTEWVRENAGRLGKGYASELARRR